MSFVIYGVTRGISSTIGLAAEKYYDHKDRKAAIPAREQDQFQDDGVVTDEQEWALSEAAEQSDSSEHLPQYSETPERTVEELVLESMPDVLNEPSSTHSPRLPYPVIIPQRRPGTKTRGFARAYPPDLAAFGIDQEAFLRFLKNFHTASQSSPALHVLSIAASATSPIHGLITFGVSLGVQIALGVAIELQERYKANTFLDQMNKELFMPRGLYAMVLVYKEDNTDTSSEPAVGIETINLETSKQISRWGLPHPGNSLPSPNANTSKISNTIRSIRSSNGKTEREMMMPLEVAPLIYSTHDNTPKRPNILRDESFKDRLDRNKKFITSYYDRRTAAEYAGNNPDTTLGSTTSTSEFRSRFADPNHPVNNGSITALVTGGRFGHMPPGYPGWRETGEDGRLKPATKADPSQETKLNDIKDVRGPIGLVGYGIGLGMTGISKGVNKVLGSNVMYLTVVNMPSEEELEVARRVLEDERNRMGLKELFRGPSR